MNVHTLQNPQKEAAVLIAIAEGSNGEDAVLLTERAKHLNIHSGEVAFPGGKRESSDENLLQTALRESEEEVGLSPSRVEITHELPLSYTRLGYQVAPYVGRIDSPFGLEPNIDELQSLFWVPLNFLLEDKRERTDIFQHEGKEYWAPVYQWADYTIWGFTARVIVEFLNQVYGQGIARENVAPEVPYIKK